MIPLSVVLAYDKVSASLSALRSLGALSTQEPYVFQERQNCEFNHKLVVTCAALKRISNKYPIHFKRAEAFLTDRTRSIRTRWT